MLGLNHLKVNHSTNFVDPVTGVHTQNIERLWRGLKDIRKRYQGIPKSELESHIAEFVWRNVNKVDYENAFIKAIHLLCDVRYD